MLSRAPRALRIEDVLNELPSGPQLKAQGGRGTRGYFAALGVVRDALEQHVRAEVSFVEVELESVRSSVAMTEHLTPTKRLIAVYRVSREGSRGSSAR